MAPSPAAARVAPVPLAVLALTVALGGVQWGVMADAPTPFPVVAWLYAPVGVLYAIAGVVALRRRPTNRLGGLLALSALAMVLSEFNVTGPSGMVAVSLVLAVVPLGFAMHLVLAFPSGQLRSRRDRLVVAWTYGTCLAFVAPLYLFAPDGATVLSVFGDHPGVREVARNAGGVAYLAAALVAAQSVARALGTYGERERRALVPLYGYGVLSLVLLPAAPNVCRLVGIDAGVGELVQVLTLAGIPIAFVATLVAGGWARSTGAEDLSLRLSRPGATTADALARALGDGSVRLLAAVPPALAPTRGLVPLEVDGRDLGAIEYDARLLADADAVRAAAAIVATSLDRERLAAELRDASARMVEAADRERRRIARDLHDGLQAKLVLLALQADGAPGGTALRDELTGAVDDLRAFVQGIMPAALIERGLDAAVEDLADRMPVPTAVRIDLDGRPLPGAVESTAYFVVAEACANTVKHAGARVASIDVTRRNGTLHVAVADDGEGGARPGHGLGLRGLRDRVDALGGDFHIASPPEGGTRITAELPCG